MALIWPWGVANPLNPLYAIEIFSHFFEKPWHELFDGMLIEPPDMPRSYVPTLLGAQAAGDFPASGRRGRARRAVRGVSRDDTAARCARCYFAVALAAVLPIAVTVIARPAMYNGIRHFVFVLPPLAVAGGLAGAWIATGSRAAPRALRRPALAALALIFAAGVALPAIGMARLHPYEYASFNHIAGGVRGAQPRFMLDYWGLAFKQAGAGAARQARRCAARRRPPGANGGSRCAARIPRRGSRSATSSSRPGIRRAPTSR